MILEYYKENTNIEIQDLFKFLYQSCFGCEHLVSDYDNALKRIMDEAVEADNDDLPDVEYLDGEYCRVHLKAFATKDLLECLCRVFIDSSKTHVEGEERLEQQLQLLKEYVTDGLMDFDLEQLNSAIDDWKKMGFPPVHHSDSFREAHHPAYRVIMKKYLQKLGL